MGVTNNSASLRITESHIRGPVYLDLYRGHDGVYRISVVAEGYDLGPVRVIGEVYLTSGDAAVAGRFLLSGSDDPPPDTQDENTKADSPEYGDDPDDLWSVAALA